MSQMLFPVYLVDVANRTKVQAEIHEGISEQSLTQWETEWVPAMSALRPKIAAVYPDSPYSQHSHWNWRDKQAEYKDSWLADISYSIVLNGSTEAMMWVNNAKHRCRLPGQAGKDLIYVEYLSVAPWNLEIPKVQTPRYKRAGSALLGMAAMLSFDNGFSGRVGLASLPQSVDFYRSRNMTCLGPDLHNPRLQYFEWSERDARRVVEQGVQS